VINSPAETLMELIHVGVPVGRAHLATAMLFNETVGFSAIM